jgi:hypothetical protein
MQHHHHQQHPLYVHYTGPSTVQVVTNNAGVASHDTTHLHQQNQQQQQGPSLIPSTSTTPLVATGDWTKDLIHLAKTAELKYVSVCFRFLITSLQNQPIIPFIPRGSSLIVDLFQILFL